MRAQNQFHSCYLALVGCTRTPIGCSHKSPFSKKRGITARVHEVFYWGSFNLKSKVNIKNKYIEAHLKNDEFTVSVLFSKGL